MQAQCGHVFSCNHATWAEMSYPSRATRPAGGTHHSTASLHWHLLLELHTYMHKHIHTVLSQQKPWEHSHWAHTLIDIAFEEGCLFIWMKNVQKALRIC